MVIHCSFISLQPTKALNAGQVKAINQKYKCILDKTIELAFNPGILLPINTFSVCIKWFSQCDRIKYFNG